MEAGAEPSSTAARQLYGAMNWLRVQVLIAHQPPCATSFLRFVLQGWASETLPPQGQPPSPQNMEPLLDTIIRHVGSPDVSVDTPFAMSVAMIERDAFIGRVATGKQNKFQQLCVLHGVCCLRPGGLLAPSTLPWTSLEGCSLSSGSEHAMLSQTVHRLLVLQNTVSTDDLSAPACGASHQLCKS